MKCPIDNMNLVMADRQGIEVDYCPECRGIWLDRGELDKIVERYEDRRDVVSRNEVHGRDNRYDDGRPYKKRRESWLSELFD